MASFRSVEGLKALDDIVKTRIPQWSNGLRQFQRESISTILDQVDLMCITATGDGKSALFAVPILVHLEIIRNPSKYPKFNILMKEKPVGLVVIPTKGLGNNIVDELKGFGIKAFAFTAENIAEARRSGIKIIEDIILCKYQIVCVDPEHLREPDWYRIMNSTSFRSNIIFGCAEEAHLIDEWGLTFRPLFRHIGTFLRGRLPSSISHFALTATLPPGPSTTSVCSSLGFQEGSFKFIRRSNERPNTKIIVKQLTSPIGGSKFPQLLEYLNEGRKTIIHVRTIELSYRVFLFLFNHAPDGTNPLRRIRTFNSLATSTYNKKTIDLINNDSEFQVVIATKAFTNGIHAKALVDSISLGTSETQNESEQAGGRVGRDPLTRARRIILAQPTELAKAQKIVSSLPSVDFKKGLPLSKKNEMDLAKAIFLGNSHCFNSINNKIYQNEPLPDTQLDCIEAGRDEPCSLCCTRYHIPEDARVYTVPDSPLLPFKTQTAPTALQPSSSRATKVTKKEAEGVRERLKLYELELWKEERLQGSHRNRPRLSYFPQSLVNILVTQLLTFDSQDSLDSVLTSNSWPFMASQNAKLFQVVLSLQEKIKSDRKAKSKKKSKNMTASSSTDVNSCALTMSNTSTQPAPSDPCTALANVTNTPPPSPKPTKSSSKKRPAPTKPNEPKAKKPREKAKTVAETTATYRPAYNTRSSRTRNKSSVCGKLVFLILIIYPHSELFLHLFVILPIIDQITILI
ncbi:hypothetical protein MPER_13216 [Moniliophthora perniciosa FA553]|nr:hypothetical protein MPER_13216 [Moniliophthora perniciosa FA553]